MPKNKSSISLLRIFSRSQFKLVMLCTLLCSCVYLLLMSIILKDLITKQSQHKLDVVLHASQLPLQVHQRQTHYEHAFSQAIDQKLARGITALDSENNLIHMKYNENPLSFFENSIHQLFYQKPLIAEFKNNIDQGQLEFHIRAYPYLSYYAILVSAFGLMLLVMPVLFSVLLYRTKKFLHQNIQPLIQAIHQFEEAEYTVNKSTYSYIREIQLFSESFNILINKFKSTKQNLAEQNQLLAWQAHHDVLTALPNRQYFQDTLVREFNHNQNQNMVVLFIDNNKFKTINDQFGHQAGDAVLIETAKRLSSTLKNDAFIARLGGDEFAVILKNIVHYQDLVDICERLQFSCHPVFYFAEQQIPFSFSIGASFAYHAQNIEELLHHADLAMYQAKRSEKKWYIHKREATFEYTNY